MKTVMMAMVSAVVLAGCANATFGPQERCDAAVLVAVGLEGSAGAGSTVARNGYVSAATTCALAGVQPTVMDPAVLQAAAATPLRPEPRP